jgi:hypothetical protein
MGSSDVMRVPERLHRRPPSFLSGLFSGVACGSHGSHPLSFSLNSYPNSSLLIALICFCLRNLICAIVTCECALLVIPSPIPLHQMLGQFVQSYGEIFFPSPRIGRCVHISPLAGWKIQHYIST